MSSTILERPWVRFGRETCGVIDAALRREWLVTNGIGGYASGTIVGANTRSHHGLLVAATNPPDGRVVLVAGVVGWMSTGDRRVPLSCHEFGDGVVAPEGYRHLESFHLDGTLPVWRFAYRDVLLERRLWMAPGANTTFLSYRLLRGAPISIDVLPLLTYRDPGMLTSGLDWKMDVDVQTEGTEGAENRAFLGASPVRMSIDRGEFRPHGEWYWNFQHRAETARGLADRGDLYAPGAFVATLETGQSATLVFSAEEGAEHDPEATLAEVRARQRTLVDRVADAPPLIQHLTLAADQCYARRGEGWTILAGYPWFLDWGRDMLIALPGLTRATGRADDAASILRLVAASVQGGLVPSTFGSGDRESVYDSADASLWLIRALDLHAAATGDDALLAELAPVVREIVARYTEGTHFGIGVDPEDGLLRAGEPGVQLTWMNAKVDEWVVTPRTGKAVELNALWYAALRTVQRRLGVADAGVPNETGAGADDLALAERAGAAADRLRDAFRRRFVSPERPWLADVVDGPDGDDWSHRPNQLFALSLADDLVDDETADRMLAAIQRSLVTSMGLRTLSRDNDAYRGSYGGDRRIRDGAYHQGTVWPWLMGPFLEALWRRHRDRALVLSYLEPFADHLRDAGLGSVSEIADGDPPYRPDGAISQAWSVAELLRIWHLVADAG